MLAPSAPQNTVPVYDVKRSSNHSQDDNYYGGRDHRSLPGMNPNGSYIREVESLGARPAYLRHGRPLDLKEDMKRPPSWEPPDIFQNPPHDIETWARDVREWPLICEVPEQEAGNNATNASRTHG